MTTKLRLLNFDDLFLLRLLLDGSTITSTARHLGLTQPAVTQRVRKIETIFECKVFQRTGRRVRLTPEGRALCNRAAAAISLMGGVADDAAVTAVTVGTRPEVGMSWLMPAIVALRRRNPQLVYHCHFGSGDEILRMLAGNVIEIVLTSAPNLLRGFAAIDVAHEPYAFVATPELAATIQHVDDLKAQILIEHDRSFPFLRYVDAQQRASLRYRDVWFLGSTNSMTFALTEGLGVGIIPEYIVRPALTRGKLVKILPSIRIDSDHFRLIYRQEPQFAEAVQLLAGMLQKKGLQ